MCCGACTAADWRAAVVLAGPCEDDDGGEELAGGRAEKVIDPPVLAVGEC